MMEIPPPPPAGFLAIVDQSVLHHKRIMIPEEYAKKYYKDELGDTVKLNLSNGCEWEVQVVKDKDTVWFHRGLESFIEDNSIGIHHLLLFKYPGNSRFNVHVFDLTATAIDLCLPGMAHGGGGGGEVSEHTRA